MTSPIERSIPDTPPDKPLVPTPSGRKPRRPRTPDAALDDLKDTNIDAPGALTRVIIPTVEFTSAGPPGGTKCE